MKPEERDSSSAGAAVANVEQGNSRSLTAFKASVPIFVVVATFFILQACLPLRTAIILGADEGFELAKATLCLRGYHLYSEIWNDQPPLLTVLVTDVLRHLSSTAFGPRVLTGIFSALLLVSLYFLVKRLSGSWTALLAALLVLASPGFLILGSTCMLEVPALALAVAALAMLVVGPRVKVLAPEVCAGVLFGLSFEVKLINFILIPLVIFALFAKLQSRGFSRLVVRLLVFATAIAVSVVVTDLLACGGAYLTHFHQSWTSHFGPLRTFAHGSPDDHPFDWIALLRNWDVTLPACIGLAVCLRRWRNNPLSLLPIAWLALTLTIFGFHRPWWHYYYIHTSIPLCWCAAIGIVSMVRWTFKERRFVLLGMAGLFLTTAAIWMGARLWLEIREIRRSRQIYTCLFLNEIAKYKPFTSWMYSEEPIYSFHAGIPMPPDLAVVMLKRFWSKEITDEKIVADLEQYKPGVVLLLNNGRQKPYHASIDGQYRLIYKDSDHLLYVHNSIATLPNRPDLSH